MTGSEHYAAAQDALAQSSAEDNWAVKSYWAAVASAHAHLASAAAAAEAAALPGYGSAS